jgi:hypothetical protein
MQHIITARYEIYIRLVIKQYGMKQVFPKVYD